jgi:hypothetical protein
MLLVKVRANNEQAITELADRVGKLTARVAELTARIELTEIIRRGASLPERHRVISAVDQDDALKPIQFLTENGFTIVRSWEVDGSRPPSGRRYTFLVRDAFSNQREIAVEVSELLILETTVRTRGRVQISSLFWICCAERYLADYLWAHDTFPANDKLVVNNLNPDEVMLAIRWGQTVEHQQWQD